MGVSEAYTGLSAGYPGPVLLYHLSKQHPDQVGPYLPRMRTGDIGTVAAEAFAVVENMR